MIRYYFDITMDCESSVDEEGVLLENVDAARREAELSLAEIVRDAARISRVSQISIIVRTDGGPITDSTFCWHSKSLH
jgi:hypothetical protein